MSPSLSRVVESISEAATPQPMPMGGQPTAFHIRQANPAAQMGTLDAVLFDQMRDGLLPLVSPPSRPRPSRRGEAWQRPRPRKSTLPTQRHARNDSALKWDTSR